MPDLVPPEPWELTLPDGALRGATWGADRTSAEEPAVLALHDVAGTHRWWVKVAAECSERNRVVAPDLRGRGSSASLPPPYGIEQHIADLARLVDAQLAHSPLVIVGHGLGAVLAVQLAPFISHELHQGMVLINHPAEGAGDANPSEVLATRIGTTYAHRSDDLAWWRRQSPRPAGFDRSTRWAIEGGLVGHGFGWQVAGSAAAVNADLVEMAAAIARGDTHTPQQFEAIPTVNLHTDAILGPLDPEVSSSVVKAIKSLGSLDP